MGCANDLEKTELLHQSPERLYKSRLSLGMQSSVNVVDQNHRSIAGCGNGGENDKSEQCSLAHLKGRN